MKYALVVFLLIAVGVAFYVVAEMNNPSLSPGKNTPVSSTPEPARTTSTLPTATQQIQRDYPTTMQTCRQNGGTWSESLPTTCGDICGMSPEKGDFCGEAISTGCDCGSGNCWNGRTCVSGTSFMD